MFSCSIKPIKWLSRGRLECAVNLYVSSPSRIPSVLNRKTTQRKMVTMAGWVKGVWRVRERYGFTTNAPKDHKRKHVIDWYIWNTRNSPSIRFCIYFRTAKAFDENYQLTELTNYKSNWSWYSPTQSTSIAVLDSEPPSRWRLFDNSPTFPILFAALMHSVQLLVSAQNPFPLNSCSMGI